ARALPWRRPAQVRAELRVAAPRSRGYWTRSRERLFANHFAMFFGAILLVFSAVAAAAPLISGLVTHYEPTAQNLDGVFAPPSPAHWLGADELGRDTLTRLVWGARVSLGAGFWTVARSLAIRSSVGRARRF